MITTPVLAFARECLPSVTNHLWQSTLYLSGAGAITGALQKQQARIRYAVWLSATVKFLVPFSVFSALGRWLAHFRGTATQKAAFTTVMQYAGRPRPASWA